jgi:hypothetical protein
VGALLSTLMAELSSFKNLDGKGEQGREVQQLGLTESKLQEEWRWLSHPV